MSSRDRYQRIRSAFVAACDAPDGERGRVLDEHCAGDAELRAEVETLLAAHASPSRFLETPALGGAVRGLAIDPPSSTGRELPERVRGFEITGLLGEGGMAVVYEALQPSLGRTVALKMLKHGYASREWRRRFEREAETVARLQHPRIAQLYETGQADDTPGAPPFFAMELVRGVPIDTYADREGLDRRGRLGLIAKVCATIAYAHAQGVVHRDLKPGNVLVTEGGEPKVLDFGIALAIDRDARNTLCTQTGQIMGTIGHMSPEQSAGTAIDERTDVYALGVMMYQLLVGRPPHELDDLPLGRALEALRTDDPTRPSVFDRSLRGDIETIMLKALAKEPEHRYQAADELGGDIERVLADQPILARAPSAWYQTRKFVRRHRALAVSTGSVVVVLALATAISTTFAISESRQRRTTADALDDLRQVTEFQQATLDRIDVSGLGEAIGRELRSQLESALSNRDQPALASFDRAIDRIDLSDAARRVLASHMLSPAIVAIDRDYADRPVVAAALRQSIAEAYRKFGLTQDAADQTRIAYETRREHLGPDHLDTLWSLTALALNLHVVGEAAEAERCYRESLAHHRRVAGPDNWATLNTTQNYSLLLTSLGRFDEALPLAEAAATTYRRVDPDNPGVPAAMNTHAYVLSRLGRFEEALGVAREAHAEQLRLSGSRDWQIFSVQSNLAHYLLRCDRASEALPLIEESADQLGRILGASHFRSLRAEARLAEILAAVGNGAEALPRLDSALALPDTSDPLTGAARVELLAARASVLESIDDRASALVALVEALEQHLKTPSGWISQGELDRRREELTPGG